MNHNPKKTHCILASQWNIIEVLHTSAYFARVTDCLKKLELIGTNGKMYIATIIIIPMPIAKGSGFHILGDLIFLTLGVFDSYFILAPQSRQNFACSLFSIPHSGQNMVSRIKESCLFLLEYSVDD